jgi:hypothetical protein
VLDEQRERELDAEGDVYLTLHPDCQHRVAAEGEEVVSDTNRLDPQRPLEDSGQPKLDRVARRPVR